MNGSASSTWLLVLVRLVLASCGLFFALGVLAQDVGGPALTAVLSALAIAMLASAVSLSRSRAWSWWLAIAAVGTVGLFSLFATATVLLDEGWRNQNWYYRRWGAMWKSVAPGLLGGLLSALFVGLLLHQRKRGVGSD